MGILVNFVGLLFVAIVSVEGIRDGENANISEIPCIVYLRMFGQYYCDAVIIDSLHVITAAHCAKNFKAKDITVHSGSSRRSENHCITNVSEIIVNKNARGPEGATENDIAILKLEKALKFNQNTNSCRLPKKDLELKPHTELKVCGWGYESASGHKADRLQCAKVYSVSSESCARDWQKQIYKGQMCAKSPISDSGFCQGDSGGPLLFGDTVVALVSLTLKGCHGVQVYTKVSHYIPWIKRILFIDLIKRIFPPRLSSLILQIVRSS